MFAPSGKKVHSEAMNTILGEGSVVTGDMKFQATMRLDGQFDGNLCGDRLIVSASGQLVGDVCAQSCVCYGQIRGSITVDQLVIKHGGRIDGSLYVDDLAVESGALLNGEVNPKKNEPRLIKPRELEGSSES